MKKVYNPNFGLFILRVVLGGVFMYHGITKLMGMSGVVGFFGSIGLPAFLAYVVAIIEAVGGLLVVLGLWTTLISFLFAIIMLGAILKAKLSAGTFKAVELEFVLLAMSLTTAFSGGGYCSLGKKNQPVA